MKRILVVNLIVFSFLFSAQSQSFYDSFDDCSQWSQMMSSSLYGWHSYSYCQSGNVALFSGNPSQGNGFETIRAFVFRNYSFKAGHKYIVKVGGVSISNPSSIILYAANGFNNGFVNKTLIDQKYYSVSTSSDDFQAIFIPSQDFSTFVISENDVYNWYVGIAKIDYVQIIEDPCTGNNASITGSSQICSNSLTSITSSGGLCYLWSTGKTTQSIVPPSSGTYSVSVLDNSGCIQTANFDIQIISPPPIPSISITGPLNSCYGSGLTSITSSSANGYQWGYYSTDVNGQVHFNEISGATNQVFNVSNQAPIGVGLATTQFYQVIVTGSNGCKSTSNNSQAITVVKPQTIDAPQPSSVICGNSTSLSTGGPNGTTYSWSPSVGLSSTVGATVTASPMSTTTYTVTGTYLGACQDTKTVTVTVNPPVISITPPSPAICSGTSANLNASGATSYSWSTGETSASINVSPVTTTTYTLTGTISGCSPSSQSVTVTVNSPIVSITSSNGLNLCNTVYTTLTAQSNGGAAYSWSSSRGDYSGTSQSLTVSSVETYTVAVTIPGCGVITKSVTTTAPNHCIGACTKSPCPSLRVGNQPILPPEEDADLPNVTEMSAYPSPASDKVLVALPQIVERDTPVLLYNMFGDLLTNSTINKGQWKAELSVINCAEGLYIVRVGNGDLINALKIMVTHK